MKKLLLLIAIASLAVQPAYPQKRAADSPKPVESAKPVEPAKQVKAGELFPLGENLLAKVSRSTASAFTSVKVQGEAVVVVLELDAGKKSIALSYKPSSDPKRTEIYFGGGEQKIAPRAVIEDFASWGDDNDKEIEVLDPKEAAVGSTINFQRKGSISLLFDVPPQLAKVPKKLSVTLRTRLPKNEEYSFVVTM